MLKHISIISLFLTSILLADVEVADFLVRIRAVKDLETIDTLYALYTRDYNSPYPNPNSGMGEKWSNKSLLYFNGPNNFDSLLVTDTIRKIAEIPYAVSMKIDMRDYHYIEIDSIVSSAVCPEIHWVEQEVSDQLMSKQVNTHFDITVLDEGPWVLEMRVVSFDSLWTNDFFLSQFEEIKYEDQYDWTVIFRDLDWQDKISITVLPTSIQKAIHEGKIWITFHYSC